MQAAIPAIRPTVLSPLSLAAFTVATLICLPLLYIGYLASSADAEVWSRLWNTRIPELLANTARLAVSVSIGTLLLGVSLAWCLARYDFPGRPVWEWAVVLPLAMPTYVLAYVYSYVLGPAGPAEELWRLAAGPQARVISPYGFWGATLVMTLDTFPFVYLLTRAALLNFNVSFDEVARVCGVSRLNRLWRLTLPLLRPAVASSRPILSRCASPPESVVAGWPRRR
jgi:iron(III) transport system permease protein